MANEKASAAFRALINDDNPGVRRSETARFNEVIADVKAALAAGITQVAIMETLKQQGFSFTKRSFETALYRLRKRKNKEPCEEK